MIENIGQKGESVDQRRRDFLTGAAIAGAGVLLEKVTAGVGRTADNAKPVVDIEFGSGDNIQENNLRDFLESLSRGNSEVLRTAGELIAHYDEDLGREIAFATGLQYKLVHSAPDAGMRGGLERAIHLSTQKQALLRGEIDMLKQAVQGFLEKQKNQDPSNDSTHVRKNMTL